MIDLHAVMTDKLGLPHGTQQQINENWTEIKSMNMINPVWSNYLWTD